MMRNVNIHKTNKAIRPTCRLAAARAMAAEGGYHMELNIPLDREGNLYEQIYVYIREEIRKGALARGDRLPSTRSLAQYLHVSRTTAQLAYDQLLAEGYIEGRRGSGSYVCGIENDADLAFQAESPPAVEAPIELHEAGDGESLIDFSPRAIDMSQFPYTTWRRIMRELMTGDRSDIFTRGDAQGDLPLRETIAHYLHLSRGCRCGAEQVVIGAGTDYLLLLLTYILGWNRTVAIENPGYSRAYRILQAAGWQLAPTAVDRYGICVPVTAETLDAPANSASPSVIYTMPARQYPMGTTMPYTRRAELLRWAEGGEDRYIIEDDYDSLFRYQGKPVPSLQAEDRSGHVIYIGTFSKSIAPAIRVSYMILPVGLLDAYHARASLFASTVPRMDQAILNAFIQGGYYERYLNRMRNRYRAKHDLLQAGLQPLTQTGHYTLTGIGAGLHLILTDVTYTANSLTELIAEEERVASLARAAGALIHPMTHLILPDLAPSQGYSNHPSWILGYAALTPEEIEEGSILLVENL